MAALVPAIPMIEARRLADRTAGKKPRAMT
jgi:hypothetical protein